MRRFLALTALLMGATSAQAALDSWAPSPISSDRFESHPAFDPLTGDLYFVRSAPDFSGWRITPRIAGPRRALARGLPGIDTL